MGNTKNSIATRNDNNNIESIIDQNEDGIYKNMNRNMCKSMGNIN
jgi:hypothetical protein